MALRTIIVCDNCGEPTANLNMMDHSAFCEKPECQKAKKIRASFSKAWSSTPTQPKSIAF